MDCANNELGQVVKEVLNGLSNALREYANKTIKMVSGEFMKSFSGILLEISKDIQRAKENPNSLFNYSKYEKRLNEMHWAWPYNIETEELFDILQRVNNEKEFDSMMLKVFDDGKVNEMILEAKKDVAHHHKILLDQIKNGIGNKNYALVNNALMSIIDNSLAIYIEDKGCMTRKGIFLPIIKYYENYPINEISNFIFDLCMLSNNINFIFDDMNFAQKVEIRTNKMARRHAALHGFKYSNKKIDTLMLLNTLVALMKIKPYLIFFENGMKYIRKQKKFDFTDLMNQRIETDKLENAVLLVLELDGMVTHSMIKQNLMEIDTIKEQLNGRKHCLSKVLQKLKRKGKIKCIHENNKTFWMKC